VSAAAYEQTLRDAAPLEGPFAMPLGPLAPIVAGALAGLSRSDWWVPGHRERIGAVLRGLKAERLADPFAGSRPYRVAPSGTSAGLRALHAVGIAEEGGRALVHLGEAALADGAFTEALNLAALRQVSVLFLLTRLPLDGAPVGPQFSGDVAALAAAYGIPCESLSDPSAEAVEATVARWRTQGGPLLVVASCASVN